MSYKTQFLACFLALFPPFFSFSQENKKIDSLKQIIKHLPVDNKIGKAQDLIKLGEQYANESDYPSAMDYYQQSLAIAQEINNQSITAQAYRHLALIAYYHGDIVKDSLYEFTGLKICRKIKDKLNEGMLLKDIGASYLNRGKLTQSKKYLEQALAIFKQLDKQQLIAGVYSNMAIIYDKIDYRKCIELELAAKKIWDKYPAENALAIINVGNIGVAYFDMVKNDSLKSVKHDTLIPTESSKNLKKAAVYIRQAIEMAKQHKDKEDEAYYTEILSELQFHKGDYKNAYLNYAFYQTVTDSIFSQSNKNKIAELESRNEIQKKNQEILNQKLRVQSQQRNILILVSGLLIMLIIGVLFYRLSIIRKQKNRALIKLNEQLDNANKLKAKFFAVLTHDLRSPIVSLVNFSQLQKRDSGSLNEEQKAAHESKIATAALSLLGVMDEILLWSKGQMENFKPQKVNVLVCNLFSYLKDFFAGVTHIEFNYHADEGLSVYTDENYLKTIMHNLTQNAVNALKHTPDATITWKAWKENNQLKLSITDNGPGMTAEQISKFEENTTVSSSKKGLGLHLVKDMAQTIDCKIVLRSSKDGGTTFILIIDHLN